MREEIWYGNRVVIIVNRVQLQQKDQIHQDIFK
jgi:hypothetical protein